MFAILHRVLNVYWLEEAEVIHLSCQSAVLLREYRLREDEVVSELGSLLLVVVPTALIPPLFE